MISINIRKTNNDSIVSLFLSVRPGISDHLIVTLISNVLVTLYPVVNTPVHVINITILYNFQYSYYLMDINKGLFLYSFPPYS